VNSEARELTERAMHQVLPGCLPSGWRKLTHQSIIWRNDGAGIAAYSGFGMKVLLESTSPVGDRQRIVLSVERTDGEPPSELDLDRVLGLFTRVRRAQRMKSMSFTLHDRRRVARYTFVV